jgi:uncharacterized protein YlxP (DUF503 family)
VIGFAECECIIYDAGSLKEKRAVLKRIITRVEYTLDLLFRLNVRGGDDGDSEAGPLPSVLIADFCGRHVELILNPRYNPLQNGSFLLRVLAFIDSFPEIERTITRTEWF